MCGSGAHDRIMYVKGTMKQNYVLGFMFDSNLSRVVLIKKKRPAWQAGLFNGAGGMVEPGERDVDAMVREFKEETGVLTHHSQWVPFCVLTDAAYTVSVYRSASDVHVANVGTCTDEHVECFCLTDVWSGAMPQVPNLRWLVAMALDHDPTISVHPFQAVVNYNK